MVLRVRRTRFHAVFVVAIQRSGRFCIKDLRSFFFRISHLQLPGISCKCSFYSALTSRRGNATLWILPLALPKKSQRYLVDADCCTVDCSLFKVISVITPEPFPALPAIIQTLKQVIKGPFLTHWLGHVVNLSMRQPDIQVSTPSGSLNLS
jgi:hypothetical protein